MIEKRPATLARRPTFVVGLVGLALATLYGAIALRTLDFGTRMQPGPAIFPMAVAVVAAAGSIAMMFDRSASATLDGDQAEPLPRGADAVRLALVLVASVVYVFLLPHLGFLLSTGLYTLFVLHRLAQLRPVRLIIVTTVITAANYWLFVVLLGVPFPSGLIV